MAKKSRPTFQKRQKEKARQEKRKDKEQRRLESKDRKDLEPRIEGEDPDIAGIIPGPQPPREDQQFDEEPETETTE